MNGDATALNLTLLNGNPEEVFYPALVEGDLLLSYESAAGSSATGGSSSSSSSSSSSNNNSSNSSGGGSEERLYGEGEGGVVWSVSASVSDTDMMTWTVFPSTGLLFPGET